MKDNSGKVLLALLAGASAGVIAGLLMAPDTGEATRDSVKKWAGKLSKDMEKNLQTSLDEIKSMSADAFSKVSGTAGDLVNEAKDAAGMSKDKFDQSNGNIGGNTAGGGAAKTGGAGNTGGNA